MTEYQITCDTALSLCWIGKNKTQWMLNSESMKFDIEPIGESAGIVFYLIWEFKKEKTFSTRWRRWFSILEDDEIEETYSKKKISGKTRRCKPVKSFQNSCVYKIPFIKGRSCLSILLQDNTYFCKYNTEYNENTVQNKKENTMRMQ